MSSQNVRDGSRMSWLWAMQWQHYHMMVLTGSVLHEKRWT